uniref:Uncharacterized protein n=1 Tax=Anopheles dirus TaxID=7168 RepID=A0A182NVE2_9DIPT
MEDSASYKSHADVSTESVDSSASSSTDKENHCSKPTATVVQRSDVFERNYQYARFYQQKLSDKKEKLHSAEEEQRRFKANPMNVSSTPPAIRRLLKFTVPKTPEVLKRNFNRSAPK